VSKKAKSVDEIPLEEAKAKFAQGMGKKYTIPELLSILKTLEVKPVSRKKQELVDQIQAHFD
jgi:hypothetical protein